ncbi:MAG: YihY/virulence factor BrkB family protein, partial [Dehalococcoidia bacterium]
MRRSTAEQTRAAGTQAAQQIEHAGDQLSLPFAGDLGLGEFIRLTARRTAKDQVLSYAGNIAFRSLFALFPALIALLWLLTVLRAERFVGVLIDLAETAMPETASAPIREMLSSVPEEQASGAFTLGALLSVAVALWALAGMTRSLMVGLNAIHGVDETRPFWRSTFVSLLLAVAISLLLVGALFLTVFGSALAREIAEEAGLGVLFRWAWEIVIWPVLVALVLCACALVYYVAPNVEQRIRWVSPG